MNTSVSKRTNNIFDLTILSLLKKISLSSITKFLCCVNFLFRILDFYLFWRRHGVVFTQKKPLYTNWGQTLTRLQNIGKFLLVSNFLWNETFHHFITKMAYTKTLISKFLWISVNVTLYYYQVSSRQPTQYSFYWLRQNGKLSQLMAENKVT